jgi:hypothetical protein
MVESSQQNRYADIWLFKVTLRTTVFSSTVSWWAHRSSRIASLRFYRQTFEQKCSLHRLKSNRSWTKSSCQSNRLWLLRLNPVLFDNPIWDFEVLNLKILSSSSSEFSTKKQVFSSTLKIQRQIQYFDFLEKWCFCSKISIIFLCRKNMKSDISPCRNIPHFNSS